MIVDSLGQLVLKAETQPKHPGKCMTFLLRTDVAPGSLPLLISHKSLMGLKSKLRLATQTMEADGFVASLPLTKSGHLSPKLIQAGNGIHQDAEPMVETSRVLPVGKCPAAHSETNALVPDAVKILRLHTRIGHVSAEVLARLYNQAQNPVPLTAIGTSIDSARAIKRSLDSSGRRCV